MWQGGDVARGTTRGCDVALSPRDRATDGPRGAWVTRVHVSYILYNIHIISLFLELANLSNPLPYLYASFPFIFSVWDYVPTRFLPCRTRGGTLIAGRQSRGPESMRSSDQAHATNGE